MYRNQYHYYWTDYHFLFTSNLSSYTYNRTCLISFLGGLGGITSSSYWNKRYGSQKGSWGNLIDSFKENTNTKVKTGDTTKYMAYMGLIGLSLLGAYCIIMKNYIH